MNKKVVYLNKPVIVSCDENCNKAWGIRLRPKETLSNDPSDYVYLSDGELGDAPVNPGTIIHGELKPLDNDQKLNKWCVKECERCIIVEEEEGKEFSYPDFSKRIFNNPYKHQ